LALEYDLVIIGATTAARAAAIEAVNLQARVALILPQLSGGQIHPQRDFYLHALAQIATTSRLNQGQQQPPTSYPWKYANAAIDRLEQQFSPGLLAAMGVDIVVGTGEFCRRPHLAFNINQRYLRAKAYLMATGSTAHYPMIPGVQEAGYLTIDRLPGLIDSPEAKLSQPKIPFRWAIIGTESIGIELAQTLAKLGYQVTLIIDTAQILPHENLDVANFIQAQLEADGVRIYLETIVVKVSQENDTKLVTIGSESIEVDEIFIALPDRPLVENFNLTGVGVDYTEQGISVNNKLRTSHRQIYACGSVCGNVLGGYQSQGLTQHEAKIAVQNALSWRKIKINYSNYNNFPWAVYTDPPLARVGMKISTARSSNRRDLVIVQKYSKVCPQAILANKTSGFCQIIVTHTGKILGAEIIGQNAPELIQTLTLAVQQKLKITDLATLPCLSPSYAELIYQTAQQWHTDHRNRLQPKYSLLNLLNWWK
jgi:pyruvate/2-oxoglutarate dehydrogenase complex dihydrolipoamide dehydrogenase (E3) component